MKIRMEIDENITENEVIIRCSQLSEDVLSVQKLIAEAATSGKQMTVYRGETEYFISPKEILFFETDAEGVCAHTRDEVYLVRYKLYELEELLPGFFVRVSKSTILNLNEIYSVEKKISTSSIVQFQNTHKQVYVSRHYLKALRDRLEEKRMRG